MRHHNVGIGAVVTAPVVAITAERFVAPRRAAPEATVKTVSVEDRATLNDKAADAARSRVPVTVATPARRRGGKPAPTATSTGASAPAAAVKPAEKSKPWRPKTRAALAKMHREALGRLATEARALAARPKVKEPKREPEKPVDPREALKHPCTAAECRAAVELRVLSPAEAALYLASVEGKLPAGRTLLGELAAWRLGGPCSVEVPTDYLSLARASAGVVDAAGRHVTLLAHKSLRAA
jgi:hypothetical protein